MSQIDTYTVGSGSHSRSVGGAVRAFKAVVSQHIVEENRVVEGVESQLASFSSC